MKVYISGKITGLEFDEARYIFNTAAILIKTSGYIPVNPFDIKPLFGIKTYWCYMIADIFELLFCDAIYLLDNHSDSRGAKIEKRIAEFLKLEIIYQ